MGAGSSSRGTFVGRNADLDRLGALLGWGREDPGSGAVLFAGDAGIGKTRSLTGAGARAADQVGRSRPARAPHGARRALRGRPRRSRPDGALGPAAAGGGGHALGRPFDTRDLEFPLSRLSSEPVVVVASYRSDDLHRRHPLRAAVGEWARLSGVTRMQLQPLADPDVRTLVRSLHPDPMPEARVRGIVARAEGNAFFVEELVSAADMAGPSLPTDLLDLLLVRVDRLDEAVRAVVRTASVAGRRVPHDLLARVVDMDDLTLDRSLRAAVEANVLVAVGVDAYALRHALLAEAIYDDLLPGERVRLHAAYARVLAAHQAEGTAADLARHARAGHDVATGLRASIEAGDEAMALAGPAEAAHHYEHALGFLADVTSSGVVDPPVDRVAGRAPGR